MFTLYRMDEEEIPDRYGRPSEAEIERVSKSITPARWKALVKKRKELDDIVEDTPERLSKGDFKKYRALQRLMFVYNFKRLREQFLREEEERKKSELAPEPAPPTPPKKKPEPAPAPAPAPEPAPEPAPVPKKKAKLSQEEVRQILIKNRKPQRVQIEEEPMFFKMNKPSLVATPKRAFQPINIRRDGSVSNDLYASLFSNIQNKQEI
jgi:hypothetical protein